MAKKPDIAVHGDTIVVKLINTRSFEFYLRKEIYSSSPYVDFGIHNQLCNVQTASSF